MNPITSAYFNNKQGSRLLLKLKNRSKLHFYDKNEINILLFGDGYLYFSYSLKEQRVDL